MSEVDDRGMACVSAIDELCFTVENNGPIPVVYKVMAKRPAWYWMQCGHGKIEPFSSVTVVARARPPAELLVEEQKWALQCRELCRRHEEEQRKVLELAAGGRDKQERASMDLSRASVLDVPKLPRSPLPPSFSASESSVLVDFLRVIIRRCGAIPSCNGDGSSSSSPTAVGSGALDDEELFQATRVALYRQPSTSSSFTSCYSAVMPARSESPSTTGPATSVSFVEMWSTATTGTAHVIPVTVTFLSLKEFTLKQSRLLEAQVRRLQHERLTLQMERRKLRNDLAEGVRGLRHAAQKVLHIGWHANDVLGERSRHWRAIARAVKGVQQSNRDCHSRVPIVNDGATRRGASSVMRIRVGIIPAISVVIFTFFATAVC